MNFELSAAHHDLGRAYLHARDYRAASTEFDTAARFDIAHANSIDIDPQVRRLRWRNWWSGFNVVRQDRGGRILRIRFLF
jgi:hypothetical protein